MLTYDGSAETTVHRAVEKDGQMGRSGRRAAGSESRLGRQGEIDWKLWKLGRPGEKDWKLWKPVRGLGQKPAASESGCSGWSRSGLDWCVWRFSDVSYEHGHGTGVSRVGCRHPHNHSGITGHKTEEADDGHHEGRGTREGQDGHVRCSFPDATHAPSSCLNRAVYAFPAGSMTLGIVQGKND